jgi:hypothetical protein
VFYAAFRLGMVPNEYLERTTDAAHLAFLAWLGMHRWSDIEYIREDESIEFDWEKECPHWGDKVASAKFQLTAKEVSTKRSPEEIERTIAAKFRMARVVIGEERNADS